MELVIPLLTLPLVTAKLSQYRAEGHTAMNIADLQMGLLGLMARATTPTPPPGIPTEAANVAVSNYWLAILLLLASVVVILIALVFAYTYHARVLTVIALAVNRGATVKSDSDDVVAQSRDTEIVGPNAGIPSESQVLTVTAPEGADVTWLAEGGDPNVATGAIFVTRFHKAGRYRVAATIAGSNGGASTLSKDIIIGAPAGASAAPSIGLPFVMKNWGRLVVVLFGVGVISALMAATILDAAAGIGILGALLGVGAVTATSGTSDDQATPPKEKE